MYRTPATKIWQPKKGNRKRAWCRLRALFGFGSLTEGLEGRGHQSKLLFSEKHRVAPPEIEHHPKPEGHAVPITYSLIWISDIVYRVYRCETCEKEWLHTECQSNEKPIDYTRWAVLAIK